ncbi:TonB-dependent receptor plug domain-containing protein [Vibrio sp. TBV020]|uniref:TonB-dependent receptor plug domain-containing protein n=1 Tax=Vibrio sp. TBV020 TaxID=3137398 RepID=UPI0038CD2288
MLKRTLLSSIITFYCFSSQASDELTDLMSMSLEELSMLDVTMETASKFSQKLTDIPAAVYVLDGERIKRSGAKTIAEALALVPGLRVSNFSAAEPMVSSRGFHGGLFNKMLVLQDGRSLYSPVYGGVYWADIDYLLEDIERIEVLRGPAGTIWGGNAENGVINIVTKSAKDTQGGLVSSTYEQYGAYSLGVRQGFEVNDDVYARAFYKYKSVKRNPVSDPSRWNTHLAGMVFEKTDDWSIRVGGEQASFEEDIYKVTYQNGSHTDIRSETEEIDSYSYYAQYDKSYQVSDNTESSYRLWFQQNHDGAYDAPGKYLTVDAEANFITELNEEHKLTYGGGYRFIHIDFYHQLSGYDFDDTHYYIRLYNIDSASDSIVNGFLQHEAAWTNRLTTVVGVKAEYFEQNDQVELSPQARVIYDFSEQQSLWAGVGRSAIAPSYMDTNSSFISTGTYCPSNVDCTTDYEYFYRFSMPSESEEIESVVTYEVGYRYLSDQFELDSTVFYSQYDNIVGLEYVGRPPNHDQVDLYQSSYDYLVDSYGIEIAAHWNVTEQFKLYSAYSFLVMDQNWEQNSSSDGSDDDHYSIDSQHIASLQSLWNINEQFEFDMVLRAQSIDYGNESEVDNFLAMDMRLGWQQTHSAPLLELLVKNVGEKEGYYEEAYSGYKQEQNVSVRVSYAY